MEKAIQTVNEFSRSIAKRMGKEEVYATFDLDWRDNVIGKVVGSGDRIEERGE